MILDKNLLFSDAQTIAVAAGNLLCTNSLDMGVAGTIPGLGGSPVHDIGRGSVPELLIQITTAVVASGGAATVQFQLVEADDAALTTNLTVVAETPAIAKATLVAGYQARLEIPPGITRRYLGVRYVVATATIDTGVVTAGLVFDKQTNPAVA